MTISAKAFIQSTRPSSSQRSPQGLKEFFRRHGLTVRQPIPLATHHFIASHLLDAGFHLRWIDRAHWPHWTMSMRADLGAARRGRWAVRHAVAAALRALGANCPLGDILVDRRRNMYDVVMLCEHGIAGTLSFKNGKARYRIHKPRL